MKSFFISHSWHDKPLARKIAETLRSHAAKVWLDEAEIKLGDSLIEKIRQAIDSVDYVIALISERSVQSQWVTRELDIAMNQEIEGRRVKVLPILAMQCQLPGFLLGKLYADMSTPKALRQSLPLLLDRLADGTEDSRQPRIGSIWLDKFADAVGARDLTTQYRLLKDMPYGIGKALLGKITLLNQIFALVQPENPIHVRLQALSTIGKIGDANLAYGVEPFLHDNDPHIQVAAIQALAHLTTDYPATQVLELLRSSSQVPVRDECLAYFSRVRLSKPEVLLSLLDACNGLQRDNTSDIGMELALAKIAGHQFDTDPELLHELLITALRSPHNRVALAALDELCEVASDLWIPTRRGRVELAEALLASTERDSEAVVGASWTAIFLMASQLPQFEDREALWSKIQSAPSNAIASWLNRLDMYNLQYIFDDNRDCEQLAALLSKHGKDVDRLLVSASYEIGRPDCLTLAIESGIEPQSWHERHILRGIVEADHWIPTLNELLDKTVRNVDNSDAEATALSLLAQLKAGRIGVAVLLRRFPKSAPSESRGTEQFLIARQLETLEKMAPSAQRRMLGLLVAAWRPR